MVDESMTDRTRMARELDDLRSLRGALTDALNALRWASAENSAVALGIQEELRGMFRQLRDEVQPAVIDAHDGLAIEMGMR